LAATAKEVKQRRKIYENVIEQEETSQQLKEKFKPLWPRIKDKSSDEAVNMVFSLIKQLGAIGTSILIHLISEYSKHTKYP
jgi:ABC-type cobalt transport system substrate-binding protein